MIRSGTELLALFPSLLAAKQVYSPAELFITRCRTNEWSLRTIPAVALFFNSLPWKIKLEKIEKCFVIVIHSWRIDWLIFLWCLRSTTWRDSFRKLVITISKKPADLEILFLILGMQFLKLYGKIWTLVFEIILEKLFRNSLRSRCRKNRQLQWLFVWLKIDNLLFKFLAPSNSLWCDLIFFIFYFLEPPNQWCGSLLFRFK